MGRHRPSGLRCTIECYPRCAEEMAVCGEYSEAICGDVDVREHFRSHDGNVEVVITEGALLCPREDAL